MTAGYSGTPLATKLGIRPGFRVALVDAPEGFEGTLAGLPKDAAVSRGMPEGTAQAEVIVLFVQSSQELDEGMPRAVQHLAPATGAGVWVAWPKKASGVQTDVTEGVVRERGFRLRVVDNKVCAIDAVWSGLRLVRRVQGRG
jgi:hypothetical protein